jgi:hypothetical protein
VRICTITIGANHTGGDYTIRVKASEGIAQWNQYSLRAAFVNGSTVDFAKTQKVKVYGDGRMTLEVYKFSKTSFDFPVIRIPPSYAGTDVDFQSFDLGDVGDGSSMTFHLSWSGDVNQSSVRCRYTGPEAPAGVEMGDCFLGDVHATTDSGRVLDFKIHVPSNYSCNYASPTGCWIRMAAAYPPDQERNADTTSWSTDGEGAPLRLYNSAQFPTF